MGKQHPGQRKLTEPKSTVEGRRSVRQSHIPRSTTHLIREVPDGHTDASCDGVALRGHRLVVRFLLVKERSRRREGHADVELGDSNFNAESSELRQHGRKARRDLADDEVALEADTVDRHALLLERLDEVEHRGRLRARLLDVVVVDVQLRVRVRRASRVERDLDEARAERVVEDVLAPGTVVVERLCILLPVRTLYPRI